MDIKVRVKREPRSVQGICMRCGKRPQRRYKYKGTYKYRVNCRVCDNFLYCRASMKAWSKQYHKKKNASPEQMAKFEKFQEKLGAYRKHKQGSCKRCGFVAEHKCQLDVHHVDGYHSNDCPDNLTTLCANCHRLIHQHLRDEERNKQP